MRDSRQWGTQWYCTVVALVMLCISGCAMSGPPLNSYEAHIRNLLLAGKVPEALSYAKEHYGRVPAYLERYAAAFNATNQQMGRCQDVARTLHTAFTKLGEEPEYLAFRSNWQFITFRFAGGKERTMTETGYHVVVKLKDIVYDAYTGPAGMKLEEYILRIAVDPNYEIAREVVSRP